MPRKKINNFKDKSNQAIRYMWQVVRVSMTLNKLNLD